MGRVYSLSYTGTLTNSGGNADLLELTPADDKPVRLLGFVLSQSSEEGDAAEEAIRCTIQRFPATVTSGSGGSAVTGQVPNSGEVAAGFSAECNNSTVATTSSTAVVLKEFSWNVRVPYEFWYPEEKLQPKAKQGEAIIVRCEDTPADDITITITFWVEEEG